MASSTCCEESGKARFEAELNIRWKDDELTESRKWLRTDSVTEHCRACAWERGAGT